MTKKPDPKPDFRVRFENLKKKGKISDKKVSDLITDLLGKVYILESQVTFLNAKVDEVKNNPLVNALLKWEERLDKIDNIISDLDNKVERCEERYEDRRDPHKYDEDLH